MAKIIVMLASIKKNDVRNREMVTRSHQNTSEVGHFPDSDSIAICGQLQDNVP